MQRRYEVAHFDLAGLVDYHGVEGNKASETSCNETLVREHTQSAQDDLRAQEESCSAYAIVGKFIGAYDVWLNLLVEMLMPPRIG